MKSFFIKFLTKIDDKLKQSPINNEFLQSQKEKNSPALQNNNINNNSITKNLYTCDARSIKLLKLLTDKGYVNSYEIFKEFLDICHKDGINAQTYFTYRSVEEQDELYAQGRTKAGNIVTNAKGGKSFHNYGLAIDIIVNNPKTLALKGVERDMAMARDNQMVWELMQANEFDKKYGLHWGGLFKSKDTPHFELSHGLGITAYKKKFELK